AVAKITGNRVSGFHRHGFQLQKLKPGSVVSGNEVMIANDGDAVLGGDVVGDGTGPTRVERNTLIPAETDSDR
ncbi:MAG: hypothetical protein ACR2N1_09930, partial [Rubripirellula sp.]